MLRAREGRAGWGLCRLGRMDSSSCLGMLYKYYIDMRVR